MNKIVSLLGALALVACNRSAGEQKAAQNGPLEAPSNAVIPPTANAADKAGPEDRIPLAEPDGPIDPKSAEGAGQVVQHYGALIEQKRFAQAERLWSNVALARKFAADLSNRPEVHLEIGSPGDPEGAAGSIYIEVPVILYGDLGNGEPFRRSGTVVLRRVNDVPGSTQEQRRWHIERIELASDA